MAIAFNTASMDYTSGSVTSKTASHTCSSGSNRVLLVSVAGNNTTSDVITGATYNGVSMTLIAKHGHGGGNSRYTYLYGLLAPATGANNIVVSASSSTYIFICAADYTGVKQTGLPDAYQTGTGSTNLSLSVSTTDDNCWGIMISQGYPGPPTAVSGCTRRIYETSFSALALFDTNGPKTPAGTLTCETTGHGDQHGILASFAPATASPIGAALHHYRQQGMMRHSQPKLFLPSRELIAELPRRRLIENRLAI